MLMLVTADTMVTCPLDVAETSANCGTLEYNWIRWSVNHAPEDTAEMSDTAWDTDGADDRVTVPELSDRTR